MITIRRALPLAVFALLLPSAALAAPTHAPKMQHAVLHAAGKYKHDMRFAHAMASAALTSGKMDITINVTTNNLPAPSALGEKAYVVWITNGTQRQSVGMLKVHGAMAALKTSTMWHTVQDLIITAEPSVHDMHPMGPVVLTGMVG